MCTTSISFTPVGWVGGRREGRWQVAHEMLCNSPTRSQRRTTATEIESAEATASTTQQAQRNAKIKNMSREYGGQWLSCCTRHVRIYAAYIDPFTHAFDQTQMDKLTLMLDPTKEFVWTTQACNKVYAYF